MTEQQRPSPAVRVTINDIAARAGVSIGAVSFALNGRKGVSEKTRARVLKVADELGWAPSTAARSLAEARTETIGLVLRRDLRTLGLESFFMRFIAGMESEMSSRGYGLLLQVAASMDDEIATLTKWRSTRRVDGILLVDLLVDDPRLDLIAGDRALPAVVVGDPSVAGAATSVWTDDAASMRAAVARLAELGHRRITRVAGVAEFAHTRIRDEAFSDEMTRRGLTPRILRTDYTLESGTGATRSILQEDGRPTALIYDNDLMAVAGLGVAHELGLDVPGDVSIIAWDDSVLCEHTFPPLTALSHDVAATGAHAIRRLFAVLDGAEPDAFLDSTATLTERGSTGVPAQEGTA
ncbi:LacI family transcriptional regulator [Microbacterium mangrovi]|uniref:LacI family transcriptional regulator n=1 Tax=Microbacterium mangrovi TaxID=1348253 RepID=A0A0B2AE48_9MICO|nr:LacI family DNA-binding transcriptional regulator [Microbacterium mangrovi]KHK99995.1 LacI family transcriptional regulator [Microbacterium mangrovi]